MVTTISGSIDLRGPDERRWPAARAARGLGVDSGPIVECPKCHGGGRVHGYDTPWTGWQLRRAFAEVAARLAAEHGLPAPEPFAEPEPDEPTERCSTCRGAGTVSAAVAGAWARVCRAGADRLHADVARVAERIWRGRLPQDRGRRDTDAAGRGLPAKDPTTDTSARAQRTFRGAGHALHRTLVASSPAGGHETVTRHRISNAALKTARRSASIAPTGRTGPLRSRRRPSPRSHPHSRRAFAGAGFRRTPG